MAKQWNVLRCKGGYIGNVFELFNNSPRRPRLAVTEDLQEAIIGTESMLRYWRKMGLEVLGIDSEPVPIRFVKDKDKKVSVVLDTQKDEHGEIHYVHERTRAGRP